MNVPSLSERFGAPISANPLFELFNSLADAYFFVKNKESKFLYLNQACKLICGVKTDEEYYLKNDHDFFPSAMAAAYIEEDLKVMREGSLLNRLWMVHNVSYRLPQWFVSSKVKVLSLKQEVLGIAGVMYPMNSSHLQDKYFQELKPVIAFVEENYMEDIKMDKLATLINCSRTQFNRRFQALLHMTPTEFLMALRVQAARRLLATTQKDIAEIAYESGFCDQSHLTRRFRILTGETPASYRKKIFK